MEELSPCELGTHEYWEKCYGDEIKNYLDHGQHGDVWFGEDIVDRVIRWMERHVTKNMKIIDCGCGNGLFLVELSNMGYSNLFGVDYSKKAIDLANAIARKENLKIEYFASDILENIGDAYDVVHDKGTYDAISLSKNSVENRNKYIKNVFKALSADGYFVITSCNWTKSELDSHFATYFDIFAVIPTPQFKFGGKVGNVVSSCVYKKKAT